MGEAPFYPIGASGWRGWLFRKLFGGNSYLGAFSQSTFMLNRGVPILVDMENLMGVYLMVPHLRSVIDRRAEMFSNADVYVVNSEGERVENHPIEALLRNPNPLQTQEQYMCQWAIYEGIYSQCFEYKFKLMAGFRPGPKCLWNLPPSNMRVIPTGKVWEQTTIEGIVEKYVMMNAESGTMERTFETKDIILTTTGVSNQYIVGSSRLLTLEKALNNIVGALRTRGAIIFDRGALGILSSHGKDASGGGIPLDPKEKERIEKQYPTDYGIQDGQIRTLVTNAALNYQPMTFPTKDLMLFEEIEDSFQSILGTFSMARDLFPSTKGATFENSKEAVRMTYQNCIQPLADSYCRSREQDPDIKPLLKAGEQLVASYEHLPAMQENKKESAEANKIVVDSIKLMVDSNMVSPAQAAQLITAITGMKFDDALASTDPVMLAASEVSPLVANNMMQTLTVNEMRQRMKLPPIDGGDVLMKPTQQPMQQPA